MHINQYLLVVACLMSNPTFTMNEDDRKKTFETFKELKKCNEETEKLYLSAKKGDINCIQAKEELEKQRMEFAQLSVQLLNQIQLDFKPKKENEEKSIEENQRNEEELFKTY